MRRTSPLGIIFGLIFGALCASIPAHGQAFNTNIVILDPVNEWRYNEDGVDLGTAWRAFSYPNESNWFLGHAAMVAPSDEPLPPDYNPPSGNPYTYLSLSNGTTFTRTFYFRTTFTNPPAPFTNIILVASNLIDDGAVFYLNGVEVGRVGMPTGTIAYATQASARNDISARGWDVLLFGPQNLRNGTNVLAVEVHQAGDTSSDVVFATGLSYFRGVRPAITRQIAPSNAIVACAGQRISFDVQATGSDLTYLWYTNGVYVTNQAGPLMTITPPVMNGTVHVIVSNALGTVRSSNATLIVFPDQCGPRPLLAESRDLAGASNQIDVTWNEAILSVAADTNNYRIFPTNQPGVSIRVTGVSGPGTTIRMTLSTNLYRTNGYVLRINSIEDARNNSIAPNTDIPIGFKNVTNIFEPGDTQWRFTSANCPLGLGSWTNLLYENTPAFSNFWAASAAPFSRDVLTSARCAPVDATSLSFGYDNHYFRRRFTIDTNLNLGARVELQLEYNVDDGAVFYLNGLEIHRVRMGTPGTAVFCTTRPTPLTGEYPCLNTTVDIDADLLRTGRLATNIIAVELHEGTDPINDDDAVFDLGLGIATFSGPTLRLPPKPRLNIRRQGSSVVLSWPTNGLGTNNGYILEGTDIITTNLWREVQPAMSNPMTNTMSGARRFYRLRWEAP